MRRSNYILALVALCLVGCDPTPPPAAPAESPSDIVSIQIVPPTPSVHSKYVVTAEAESGDKVAASRMMTWARPAPGETVINTAAQRVRTTRNALPEVAVDATGIHAKSGGGSTTDQAGRSWFQRTWDSIWNFFSGWSMIIPIILLVLLLLFVLPLIFPALAPICASILSVLSHVLTLGVSTVVAMGRRLSAAKATPPTVPPAP